MEKNTEEQVKELRKRVNLLEEEFNQLKHKFDQLDQKIRDLKGRKKAQPDHQIRIWGKDGAPNPGSPEIAELIGKSLSKPGHRFMDRNEAQGILNRKKTRTIEIMKEIGEKHPDLEFEKRGGNKSSILKN